MTSTEDAHRIAAAERAVAAAAMEWDKGPDATRSAALSEACMTLRVARAAADWRGALTVIASRGGANRCEHTHDSSDQTCRRPGSGRKRVAEFTAGEWCDACVAADALDRNPT